MKYIRCFLVAALFLHVSVLFADTKGKISGTIVDKKTSEPLIGVNIILVGSTMGAATDFEGYYAIINIPPGKYDVRISSIGFTPKVVKGIVISSGQTTTLNESLSEETIEANEVVVTADRPMVDTRQTSAVAIMSEEQISLLPVQNLQDIVNLQAGVVDGHFRGGRLGEVQYQVDGVTVNNPLTNAPAVSLDRSVLQEVQVISGTFDAEYGQAMSGVVNAVLRSGRSDAFEWSAETYVGDHVVFGKDDKFSYIERINPIAYHSLQLTMSGPTGLPNTTFLLSGRRYSSEGYLYGERRFLPTDSADFESKIFNGSGDKKIVPMSTNDEWSGQAKISNTMFEGIQFSYQAIFNYSKNRPYNYAFRLNPDGVKIPEFFSLVHGLDITQMLSDKVFYTLNFRENSVYYNDYKYESVYDPRYYQAGPSQGDANYEMGASVQGVDLGRYMEETHVYIAKASVTAQATNLHLLKFGTEIQLSDITYGTPNYIIYGTVNGVTKLIPKEPDDSLYIGSKNYRPTSFMLYAQDRIEWKDVMVRAGVRMEYFDANSTVPSDLQNPANSISGAPASRSKATTNKIVFAPRLGVSYPIIVNGSIYFSYGHFYQLPAINQFFSNSNYSVLKNLAEGGVSYGVLGNPDLRPEFTTQYEFGLKAQISDNVGIDGSLFYKDIRDLLGVEFIETYNTAKYSRLTNVDFGSVGGFTLAFDMNIANVITTSVDYSYQNAIGNSSDPYETATRAAAGKDANPRETPFGWDQRHTINGQLTFFDPNNYSITTIVKYGSGQPFTPVIGSGFGADLENNSARKTEGMVVDLRGEKQFEFAGIPVNAFVRVFNLLNTDFFNGFVFATTGSVHYSLTPVSDQVTLSDPGRFYAPRRIEIGISVRGLTNL